VIAWLLDFTRISNGILYQKNNGLVPLVRFDLGEDAGDVVTLGRDKSGNGGEVGLAIAGQGDAR
jgi:hypothetical protein